jgi:hypothetical protein
MPHHNYISRNIFVSILAIVFLLTSPLTVSAQGDGFCCDPDAPPGNYDIANCVPGTNTFPFDGCVEDPDCDNYNFNNCLNIPISDGIPLLIIAGGVFAFYRLREKKELVVIEA